MSDIVYDVAVIGGGIAGSSAVISLAQAGIRVLWVRPDWQARLHKVGESLAPAANPILESLGLSHLLNNMHHRKANATFSAWGQAALIERNSAVHLEGAGNIIDRNKFEHDLFLTANESCSKEVCDSLVSLQEEDDDWAITTKEGKFFRSKFIIDATGRSQVVGKLLSQLNEGRHAHCESHTYDHLVAAYGFVQQKKQANVIVTPATLLETVTDGWWYASLLPTGALTLNYYSDPDLMPKGLSSSVDKWLALIKKTQHIAYWIDDAEFEIITPPQLASAASRWLTPAAGFNTNAGMIKAGWAAIGDAAVAFDPLSAHGMTTALWAAAQSADFVTAYLSGNEAPLTKYILSVEQGRKQYLLQRNHLYSQERRFAESDFWARRINS